MRGPGDLLGVRQSGLPSFVLGSLVSDTDLIQESRQYANRLLKDESLQDNKQLRQYISSIRLQLEAN